MSNPWLNPGLAIASPFLSGTRTFNIERRQETIGSNGRTMVTVTVLLGHGTITPGSGGVSREDSFETQGKSITVVTRMRLYGVAANGSGQVFQPDRIIWRGDKFQVASLNDMTEFGGGYVVAVCNSVDLVDQGPQP